MSASPSIEPDPRRVRAALLGKVGGSPDMAALGAALARVVGMASSDDRGTQDLTRYVLSDAALTKRILRLVNTVRYRTASGMAVTTISRAITLLGFDNVKTTALAMLLVDGLAAAAADGPHARCVRVELEAALCASLVGGELGHASSWPAAEEAAFAALFKNLGPLLVAVHENERYLEVQALAAAGEHTPHQAARMILGCSYEALSEAVLDAWQMPATISRVQVAPPDGVLPVALERAAWMRQVAAFAHDVARLLGRTHDPAGTPEAQGLLERYGIALGLDAVRLETLFETVGSSLAGLLQSMGLQPMPRLERRDGKEPEGLPNVLLLATLGAGEAEEQGVHPSGKPRNAADLLLAGVQDVTQMRACGERKANEIMLAVLETLYQALGFRFAALVLKDVRTGQFRARASFGLGDKGVQDGFAFPAMAPGGVRDIFHLALGNDADLVITDAHAPKIRDLLPTWHRILLPDAASFVVLPLVVGKAQLGMFYADRTVEAPEGIPPDETALIKALKMQVLTALGCAPSV
ncbi:HDOD domain-containing protein [Massilia sp. YIM B02763]|uniref:HDOD domain-containing protein n=1 Tax=Massilia sp. YIM B02763 TaxID=3050130 RepID=UPI0025B6D567|nr:HDOD domain-containing protein [Massilia sp. YIM B02763]MDN4056048.1 HDOD domain-containing protein [Massilia sp. YIM B02763]